MVTLIIVLAIASFFRLYNTTEVPPGLYPDEAMNGNNALEVLETGEWKVYYPENNGREGLFINIQALLLSLTGVNEPWILRLPSAIFGVLTVLGFYLMLRELLLLTKMRGVQTIVLAGSFFMATSVWHIIFSRIGFRAVMAPLFLVWGIYFLALALRKRRLSWAFLAGIPFGLGMYTYIAYRPMPILAVVLAFFCHRQKDVWRALLGTAVVAMIIALPLLLFFYQSPQEFLGRTGQISVFNSETPFMDLTQNTALTLGMFNIHGDSNWRHNIAGEPQLFWPVGILFILGFILAIRRRSAFDWLMMIWFVLALLPVVISNEGMPHALRAILILPPVMSFAGTGFLWIWQTLANRLRPQVLYSLLALGALMLIVHTYTAYFVTWAESPHVARAFSAEYVELGRAINAVPPSESKLVVVRAGGVPVRGLSMPAQTVMFITDSFTAAKQNEKNIRYMTDAEYKTLEGVVSSEHVFFID
ncbi:MAG: glycosyltransferase family 39 protein [Candidatus Colwellbacteria bacterium]|nr:glycosyltransferase family 39 protein [Candidatus Colwellbacteria bacterium]